MQHTGVQHEQKIDPIVREFYFRDGVGVTLTSTDILISTIQVERKPFHYMQREEVIYYSVRDLCSRDGVSVSSYGLSATKNSAIYSQIFSLRTV